MRNMLKFLLYTTLLLPTTTNAFWPFTPHHDPTPAEKIASLEEAQANYPDDVEINYNLGVALYKNKQFEKALANFDRVLKNPQTKKYTGLLRRCLFNAGNGGYQHTIKILPLFTTGWLYLLFDLF